jgi:hypothetical protein
MSTDHVRRPTVLAGLAVLAVVAFVANNASTSYGVLSFLAVTGGGVLAVSTGLASRDEPLAVFAASVLVPVGGVAVLAAAVLSVADLPLLQGVLDPFVLLALAAAGFGAVAAFTGGVGGGAVGRAFSVVVASTALPFLAGVAAVLVRLHARTRIFGSLGDLAGLLVGVVVSPTGHAVDVAVFVFLLAVTGRALAAGVSAAPVVELAPRHRREDVARLSRRIVVGCLSVWRLAALSWLFVFLAVVAGAGNSLASQLPAGLASAFGALASSGAVRVAMLGAVGVSLVVVAVRWVARVATGDHRESLRRVAPTAGGGFLAVVVGVVLADDVVGTARGAVPPGFRELVDRVVVVFGEPALALGTLVVPMVGVAALLLVFAALGRVRAVPQQAAPAAVASAGLVFAGLVAGIQRSPPAFVFGTVAAGLVAWDVGEYGVTLVGELGRGTPTARVELVHVAASMGVGLLAYYAAFSLSDLTGGLASASATSALAGLVAAGVGLAALVAALSD